MRYPKAMSATPISNEALSDLIGLVYDSAFDDQPWQGLLDHLTFLFPGVGAYVYAYDERGILPEYTSSGGSEFIPEVASIDLMDVGLVVPKGLEIGSPSSMSMAQAVRHMKSGFVARTKLLIDEETLKQSDYYKILFEPFGFKLSLQIKIEHIGDKGVMIGFGIPADPVLEEKIHDPLFHLMKLLSPHLLRAAKLARALVLSKRANEMFAGLLDGVVLPLLVTNGEGKFLYGNDAARRLLERGDVFRIDRNGHVATADASQTKELRDRLKQFERFQVTDGMRVEAGDTMLSVALAPFQPALADANAIDRHILQNERLCAIFVGQARDDSISAELLSDVFDLTAREAEVCKELLAGRKAHEIAEAYNKSPRTIQNQIQAIYDKIGVASQVELLDALVAFRMVGTLFEKGERSLEPDVVPGDKSAAALSKD